MRATKFFSSSLVTGFLTIILGSTLVACVFEDAPPRRLAVDAPSTTVDPAAAVMRVTVDTDQVMNADPGQGVGIFTEYLSGGKWHIWWTCDTALSRQDCDVSLSAVVSEGIISDINAAELQGGLVTSPTPSRVEARIRTSTQVHGVTFMTNPGAVITLEASIGGLTEGSGTNASFFFFVQAGTINGGFTGRFSNPLQLQGSRP